MAFVRREGGAIVKSDNLFQCLGIHEQTKQEEMEDVFYAYARNLIRSMAKIVSERSAAFSSKSLER